jgi:hypothetical protein
MPPGQLAVFGKLEAAKAKVGASINAAEIRSRRRISFSNQALILDPGIGRLPRYGDGPDNETIDRMEAKEHRIERSLGLNRGR